MRRYILTGTPGAGKTSILRLLEARGYSVIDEAATAVIAQAQARRQADAAAIAADVQVYDRSPICTHALACYLGRSLSPALAAEISRIERDQVYERQVFFIRNLGFCEPTAARRISFTESLVFERIHSGSYRGFGYELIDIPAAAVAARTAAIPR